MILPMATITRREESEKRRKRTSLIKLGLSTVISLSGLIDMLIIPTTTLDTKNAPPRTLFRPTSPSPVLVKDTILAKTSGAPLPRERRVTPAIVGDSLKILDKPSKEGQKY